jgi:hypothetical protein
MIELFGATGNKPIKSNNSNSIILQPLTQGFLPNGVGSYASSNLEQPILISPWTDDGKHCSVEGLDSVLANFFVRNQVGLIQYFPKEVAEPMHAWCSTKCLREIVLLSFSMLDSYLLKCHTEWGNKLVDVIGASELDGSEFSFVEASHFYLKMNFNQTRMVFNKMGRDPCLLLQIQRILSYNFYKGYSGNNTFWYTIANILGYALFLCNCLIGLFVRYKCGEPAQQVFDNMSECESLSNKLLLVGYMEF